uniref:Candidate secreted effector n=1 Tax=Meloidogyne incognita TaxID=6306 RepID=A0A914NJX2_MELIC
MGTTVNQQWGPQSQSTMGPRGPQSQSTRGSTKSINKGVHKVIHQWGPHRRMKSIATNRKRKANTNGDHKDKQQWGPQSQSTMGPRGPQSQSTRGSTKS